MAMVHKDLRIHGKVQGVYFRASAQKEATHLGLTGIVRNERDGSVYAEAEGDPDAVEAFVAWCRSGPTGATVTDVQIQEGPPKGYRNFVIERSL